MTKLLMRLSSDRRLLFLFCLLLSLATRAQNFGDWNFEVDDQFYFLVGHRLLEGGLLYVDIFDRKGPALYLTYAFAALFGKSPISYQLLGTLATTLAAYGIARIAAHLGAGLAGIVASAVYCLYMVMLGGGNGQTPVFYNPLMIACAWAVVTRIDLLRQGRIDRRIMAGFAAAGLAGAYKQSAVFEGVYFGLVAVWLMSRSDAPASQVVRNGLVLAAVGMLPIAACALFYLAIGHFADLWLALVGSVTGRTYGFGPERYLNLAVVAPLAAFVLIGWIRTRDCGARPAGTPIVIGWIAVATLAIGIFPAIYTHYMMTLIAPLCLGALPFFSDLRFGAPLALFAALANVWGSGEWNWPERIRSREQSQALVEYLQGIDMPREMLIWGYPNYLYELLDKKPPSKLAFAAHLFDRQEVGSKGMDEVAETRQILARKPSVVIVQRPEPLYPQFTGTEGLVLEYLQTCQTLRAFEMHDHFDAQTQLVYSDCGGH